MTVPTSSRASSVSCSSSGSCSSEYNEGDGAGVVSVASSRFEGGKSPPKTQESNPSVLNSVDVSFGRSINLPNGLRSELTGGAKIPEICFYETYDGGSRTYTYPVKIKDPQLKQQAQDIYVKILQLQGVSGKEIDSIDFYNQVIHFKNELNTHDLNISNPEIAKELQELYEAVKPKNSVSIDWPEFHKTGCGYLKARPWFQHTSFRIDSLKQVSATTFIQHPIVQEKLKDMAPLKQEEILKKLCKAQAFLEESKKQVQELHALYTIKLSKDPAISGLNEALLNMKNWEAELNSIDHFALFYFILAEGDSEGNLLDKTNNRVEEIEKILMEQPSDRYLDRKRRNKVPLTNEEKAYAKSVAVASGMTDRHDCRRLCAAQHIPVRRDPLEWLIFRYVIKDKHVEDFFDHPHINSAVGSCNAHTDLDSHEIEVGNCKVSVPGMGKDFKKFVEQLSEIQNVPQEYTEALNSAPKR